jgi:hypothetical protein
MATRRRQRGCGNSSLVADFHFFYFVFRANTFVVAQVRFLDQDMTGLYNRYGLNFLIFILVIVHLFNFRISGFAGFVCLLFSLIGVAVSLGLVGGCCDSCNGRCDVKDIFDKFFNGSGFFSINGLGFGLFLCLVTGLLYCCKRKKKQIGLTSPRYLEVE